MSFEKSVLVEGKVSLPEAAFLACQSTNCLKRAVSQLNLYSAISNRFIESCGFAFKCLGMLPRIGSHFK